MLKTWQLNDGDAAKSAHTPGKHLQPGTCSRSTWCRASG
jgi:hypothetical protein